MTAGESTVEVPSDIAEYLQAQHALTLATASPSGVPRASTFLYVSDGATLYFWTRASTVTARHIAQNPVVSFAIGDYTSDLNQTRGIQGMGECLVLLSGEQIARVADLFGQKFPTLSPGSTMSISFFKLTPTELQFIDNTASTPAASETRGGADAFGAEFHRERSYSVITNLPAQAADKIVATLQTTEVTAGETVSRQGAPADKFFIVVEGEVDVVRNEDGRDQTVASLKAGQLYGEVAIMRDAPRTASVRARTDAKLLALSRDAFRDLVADAMELAHDFDQVIRARIDSPDNA